MTRQTVPSTVRVGLLVLAASVLLYVGYVFLGGKLRRHGVKYFVAMTDAGGVNRGTRVSMAGVQIGEATEVKLLNPRAVQITIEVDPQYHIPQGSTVQIPTQFISLGESGMVVVPPTKIAGDLEPGATLIGSHPGPLDGLFPDTKTTIQTVNETLTALKNLLKDEDLKGNIKSLLASSAKTMKEFEHLAAQTNSVLTDNQSEIHVAMSNAASAMADVHKGASLVYKMLKDGRYQEQATELLKHLDETSQKAGKLMDHLTAFVQSDDLHKSLSTTLQNAQDLSATGKEIADKTNKIVDNGVTLSQKAVGLTDQASEIATEAKTLLVKIEGLVDKVGGKVDTLAGKLPKSPIGPIHAEIDEIRESKPNYNRTDANFVLPIFGNQIYFGIYDAFASNKLNLQLGRQLTKNAVLRYGAYAGTEGLGVDYRLAPRLGLKADVYNANKPRFDALAKYDFGKGFVTWFGLDRILDRNGITFGIGIEK